MQHEERVVFALIFLINNIVRVNENEETPYRFMFSITMNERYGMG
jgi:hypothetical protein